MHAVAIQTSNNSIEARLPCYPDFPSLGPGAHQLTYSDPWAQAPLAIVWTTLQWDCSLQLICVAALAVDGSQGLVIRKLKLAVLQLRLLFLLYNRLSLCSGMGRGHTRVGPRWSEVP